MEVHRELGSGFLEAVYQEAMAIELAKRSIPFKREVILPIRYKNITLDCGDRVDFVCYGEIIVELKALNAVSTVDQAQVLNYLKATGFERGLILNFGTKSLVSKRMYLSDNTKSLKYFQSADQYQSDEEIIAEYQRGRYER